MWTWLVLRSCKHPVDGTNIKIRSLSNSVFEGRTSTGSRLFASLGSASNTNLLASRHIKRGSASLPVDVRRLKRLCWSSLMCLGVVQTLPFYNKNPRVRTWFLRTCQAKIYQLGPLYTRTCLAWNLKQDLIFYNLLKKFYSKFCGTPAHFCSKHMPRYGCAWTCCVRNVWWKITWNLWATSEPILGVIFASC